MDGLALARRILLYFLLAAMDRSPLDPFELPEGPAPPHAHTVHAQCILTKLNSDSKRLIADFLGAPVGKELRTLNIAFRNLEQLALSIT
jgi:hypothetical protein